MRARIAAFIVALVVFELGLALMQPPPVGDQPHYALAAISLARDGDLDLADEYADPRLLREVFGTTAVGPHAFRYPGAGDALRSTHGPGLAVLVAPVAALTTSLDAMRAVVALVGAIAALLLWILLERVGVGSTRVRWAAWAAVVLSAPVVVYAGQLYPELPAAALVLAALVLLTGRRRGPAALAGAATAAALLPWLNVRFLALTAALALALLWVAWRAERRVPALAAVVAPLALSGAAFALAFAHWYGSPWPSAPYALAHGERSPSGIYRLGVGGLLSPTYGWLPVAPIHLLGLVALGLAVRRLRRPALAAIAGAALYLLAIAAGGAGFPGFSFAGRHQVVVAVPIAVALAVLLAERPRWRLPCAVAGALSLALTAQAIADRGAPASAAPGTPRAAYQALWPSFDVDAPDARWTASAARLAGPAATVTRRPPLPPAEGVAALAPAGAAGTLLEGASAPLPPGAYAYSVQVRAGAPTPDRVAELRLDGPGGKRLDERPLTGTAVPPELGYRTVVGSFHLAEGGPVAVALRTTGAAEVRSGGVAIAFAADQTLVGASGFPGLPKALLWLGAIAAGGALALRAPRGPRRPDPPPVRPGTSGTTARARAATR